MIPVAVCVGRDSRCTGNGKPSSNGRKRCGRSARCFAAITRDKGGRRLIPAADSWFPTGQARLPFPAPPFWAMHPAGLFEASYVSEITAARCAVKIRSARAEDTAERRSFNLTGPCGTTPLPENKSKTVPGVCNLGSLRSSVKHEQEPPEVRRSDAGRRLHP